MQLYNDDCLKILPTLADKSIDLVLCDLPYGVTHNKWDMELPLDKLWQEYKRIIKPNGAIVLFGQGLFSAKHLQRITKPIIIWYIIHNLLMENLM